MRTLLTAIVLTLIIGQIACQDEPKGITTANGHRFINHTNKQGDKAKPGEYILVYVDTWIGDSLMQSIRRDLKEPRELRLPTPEQIGDRKPPTLYDAAILMAKGDSATLIEKIDSQFLKFLPPNLKNEREVRYEVVMVDFYDEQGKAEKLVALRIPGEQFLEENKTKPGIQTTESGLQYQILKKGPGGAKPKATDRVKVHYHGTTIEGNVFDSSVDRGEPASFGLNQVIAGWTEGLQLMSPGDKFKFFIPTDLAYGANSPSPDIPPFAVLVFDVELLEILKPNPSGLQITPGKGN